MADMHTPAQNRSGVALRAFAFFLDISIVVGLSALLMLMINTLFQSTLGVYGIKISGIFVMLPLFILYITYFSSEILTGRSLGKQLIGIEIRGVNGESADDQALLSRFFIKHIGSLVFFLAFQFNDNEILQIFALIGLVFYVLSGLMMFGSERLSIHDRITQLAVYSTKVPQTDLSQVSLGKTDIELAQQVSQMREENKTQGKQIKVPPKSAFPCAVELKVYTHDKPDMMEMVFDCFAEFVPNVHPNQVQAYKTVGTYQAFRVIMKFENPMQMETSYKALSQRPEVVMTITVKSVRPNKKKGTELSLLPQTSMG